MVKKAPNSWIEKILLLYDLNEDMKGISTPYKWKYKSNYRLYFK